MRPPILIIMSEMVSKPGDAILDRYAPHLQGAEREEARERLLTFVRAMLRSAVRQQLAQTDPETDSPD